MTSHNGLASGESMECCSISLHNYIETRYEDNHIMDIFINDKIQKCNDCLLPMTYNTIYYIIIICRNRKSGWMPHKWKTKMVCNLHFPKGTTSEFGIEGHIRRENLTSFLAGWKTSYYWHRRCANPRPPAHPGFKTSKESHALLVRPSGSKMGPIWLLKPQGPHE